jgi:DNA-binding NtrC family response regulator
MTGQPKDLKGASGPTVLLIDDEPTLLQMLQRLLTVKGYRVLTTPHASDAERLMAEQSPDVVVIDLRMRGMSGIEVIRRLRARSPTVRLVVYSGVCTSDVVVECLHAGANDFVAKLGDPTPLVERIAGRPRKMSSLSSDLSAQLLSAKEARRQHWLNVLAACNDNVTEAAEVLGVSRTTLQRSLRMWERDISQAATPP